MDDTKTPEFSAEDIQRIVTSDIPKAFVGLDASVRQMSKEIESCRRAIEHLKRDAMVHDLQLYVIESMFAESDLFNRNSQSSTLQRRREGARQRWLDSISRIVKEDFGVSFVDLKTRTGNPVLSQGVVIESIVGGDA